MRWVKVLAIAIGIVIVFFVISPLLHLLFTIGIIILIAAALFAAFKGYEQYKLSRQRHEERRQQRLQEREQRQQQREQRRASPSIEAPRQQPTGLPPASSAGFDVDEELARLKREMPGS
jgi:type II secretory pathway pseudopilin PulG